MKFKRIVMICILALFFVLNSCGTAPVRGNIDPPAIDIDIYADPGLDIEPETSYDNLVAYTEKSVYSQDENHIVCYVKNNNKGKGFYFYNTPYVEKKINDEWVRLYYDSSTKIFSRYGFCGKENDKESNFTASLHLYTEFVTPKMDEGTYRIVIFTPKNVLYAKFSME